MTRKRVNPKKFHPQDIALRVFTPKIFARHLLIKRLPPRKKTRKLLKTPNEAPCPTSKQPMRRTFCLPCPAKAHQLM
uniref:Uncharacterized protein n=1 Tax=uncultured Rhodospirillales bacterium HF0200_01O14 TaxID=710787 RepID=E0XTX1_9PROT|nr:hypothetical protein [uncultured Rhodospirillales bacterium HF0200_01O14]